MRAPERQQNSVRAAVLTFSPIARDRRVLRQCALLAEMGARPHVIAYGNAPDHIPYEFSRWPVPQATAAHRVQTVLTRTPAHLGLAAARAGFWSLAQHRWAYGELVRTAAPLVIANDWPALVVAAAYKQKSGARIHYDSHEFATLEFDERRWWRVVYKPMVQHLEAAALPFTDSVSTVGPRLAQAMQEHYGLATTPAVVRNIPDAIALPEPSEPLWPLRLLFHGHLQPGRGIETIIASAAQWQQRHRLIIRGSGREPYVAELKRLAANSGLTGAVSFEPAVALDDVIAQAARTADIGLFFTPLDTTQQHFTMPNKLFEYISAGLAVAISPAADMARIVEHHDIGVVAHDASAEAAAAAINSLDVAKVAHFKVNARKAAATLNWDNERHILRQVLTPLLSASTSSDPKPTC